LSTLTTQATTLTLGQTAPDTKLFAVIKRVLKTVIANYTTAADFFGFAS
jgi:hypothetical protein